MTFPKKSSDYWIRSVKTAVSTQDIVLRMAETTPIPAPTGTVVVADRQTGGRGREGREWLSPEGGLWLSILLHEKDVIALPAVANATGAGRFLLLPLVAGLAVADLAECCGGRPRIKWPNDVLIGGRRPSRADGAMDGAEQRHGGRKLAGILSESRSGAIAVGIGVNIAAAPLATAATIAECAGAPEKTPSRDECLMTLLDAFAERAARTDTVEEVDRLLAGRDGPATWNGRTVTILGLDPGGGLRVRGEKGEEIIRSGEITLMEVA